MGRRDGRRTVETPHLRNAVDGCTALQNSVQGNLKGQAHLEMLLNAESQVSSAHILFLIKFFLVGTMLLWAVTTRTSTEISNIVLLFV